jgi:hypothetical protein
MKMLNNVDFLFVVNEFLWLRKFGKLEVKNLATEKL